MRTLPAAQLDLDTIVRAPSGELDLAVVPELRARLAEAHRPGIQLVLDLRDVTFMDSSALSVVLAADRRLAATGGALRLAHPTAEVRRVLRICGLADLVLAAPSSRRRRSCGASHRVHRSDDSRGR